MTSQQPDDYQAYLAWKASQNTTDTFANDLVSSGARPVQPDMAAIVKQLQDQADKANQQIAALMAERGIPADPIAAQLQALADHVRAQSNANPMHSASYTDLASYVGNLTSDNLTSDRGQKLRYLVEDLQARHPGHELAYIGQLARDLYRSTLDDGSNDDFSTTPVTVAPNSTAVGGTFLPGNNPYNTQTPGNTQFNTPTPGVPDTTGEANFADYQSYLAWKNSQKNPDQSATSTGRSDVPGVSPVIS